MIAGTRKEALKFSEYRLKIGWNAVFQPLSNLFGGCIAFMT